MKTSVAVWQTRQRAYSTDWATAEIYAEGQALRQLYQLLGYSDGNPFREVVRPGNRVVIKPNWVLDKHPYNLNVFSIVTHPAVLRAVADLVYEALDGTGEIIIADAPQFDCDFANLMQVTGAPRISEYFWSKHRFEVQLRDLRQICCPVFDGYIKSGDRVTLPGDPDGYAVVDLGKDSAFIGMPQVDRLYGADYDRQETIKHHNADRHEYLVSKTILGADVFIHVPKLKVHKKVGVTLNAKGMVGINGNKNWLAHFRVGPPALGGDEFPDQELASVKLRARVVRLLVDRLLTSNSKSREALFNVIYSTFQRVRPYLGPLGARKASVDGGNWHGNDTAWRMTVDLARIILYADREGRIRENIQRPFYSVIDGIIGGEREGPLAPHPKAGGVLIAGTNLLAVDIVGARLMGFDWRKIRHLQWLLEDSPQTMGIADPAQDVRICSNVEAWEALLVDPSAPDLAFVPHPGWVGHIEIDRAVQDAAGVR